MSENGLPKNLLRDKPCVNCLFIVNSGKCVHTHNNITLIVVIFIDIQNWAEIGNKFIVFQHFLKSLHQITKTGINTQKIPKRAT